MFDCPAARSRRITSLQCSLFVFLKFLNILTLCFVRVPLGRGNCENLKNFAYSNWAEAPFTQISSDLLSLLPVPPRPLYHFGAERELLQWQWCLPALVIL